MSALSGGQRQSIATLMALNPIPKLLLLDEHTSALDPKTKKQILSYTDKHIIEHNITTIMITHNIDDAIKYGNRLIIMNMGSIIFDVKGAEKKELTAQKILKILHENEGYHD
jgi:putative tryptophan/tyrosine transport system ATP-binding protein